MAELDRSELIGLLDKLGAADDGEVLAAARGVHARVSEAGLAWGEVLRPVLGGYDDADDLAEDDLPEDDEAPVAPILGDKAEDGKLIDQLLARKGLSREMRQSLAELKRGLSDGTTDATDRRYIRALAKRLGV